MRKDWWHQLLGNPVERLIDLAEGEFDKFTHRVSFPGGQNEIVGLLLLQPACSGSSTQAPVSGTPAGVYTVTVTATAGSDTKSQNVTLSVP